MPKNAQVLTQREKRQRKMERKKTLQKRRCMRAQRKQCLIRRKEGSVTKKQPNTHSLQFQLQRPNPAAKREFYQTAVDETVASDTEKISEKIREFIPKIKERKFALKWLDSEGNEFPLSTNETLVSALKKMDGPVHK